MKYFIALFLLIVAIAAKAQVPVSSSSVNVSLTLSPIALLDIEPDNSPITLAFGTPSEAGNPLSSSATNNSKWINFTSAVTPGGSRKVTVQITSGSVPSGVLLKLVTANSGSGAGSLGSAVSPIYVTGSQSTIINSIGGAYTGNGAGNGCNLTYSLEVQDYSLLRNSSNSFTITYTIMDN